MKKKEEFIIREIAGEYVMVPIGKTAQKYNGLITVNNSFIFVWEHLEKVDTIEQLVDLVCQEYDVSYDEAMKDILDFVARMKTMGWIE